MRLLRRLPGLLREALLYELALYRSLARWLARRPDVPRGATPIGYSRLVAPMLWLWIFGSSVEVVVVEVVLRHLDQPWAAAARVPLLVLGIWGVAWMLASYRVRPHLLTDTELRARSGARTWLVLPLDAVESTRVVEHEVPGVIRALHVERELGPCWRGKPHQPRDDADEADDRVHLEGGGDADPGGNLGGRAPRDRRTAQTLAGHSPVTSPSLCWLN